MVPLRFFLSGICVRWRWLGIYRNSVNAEPWSNEVFRSRFTYIYRNRGLLLYIYVLISSFFRIDINLFLSTVPIPRISENPHQSYGIHTKYNISYFTKGFILFGGMLFYLTKFREFFIFNLSQYLAPTSAWRVQNVQSSVWLDSAKENNKRFTKLGKFRTASPLDNYTGIYQGFKSNWFY